MKPIELLTNVEKANVLHQLFPNEIPGLLRFVQDMCATIKEQEQQQKAQWDNGLFDFDFWLSLLKEVERKIIKYGSELHKQPGLFSDQLFDGYLACYMVHCLITYTTIRRHPNRKFTVAIDLLFNP